MLIDNEMSHIPSSTRSISERNLSHLRAELVEITQITAIRNGKITAQMRSRNYVYNVSNRFSRNNIFLSSISLPSLPRCRAMERTSERYVITL
uniref:Uncharacterized protein n=1 Tax=Picea glauca TaxID=3330 RepID=A0A117NFZ8_PICGL|nr:hypothetical protein ABT39_MTgene2115 [Picea glauca]QHR86920.1 hypothetical protein Q903MT_gene927 [Picea sitchensis]